MPKTERHIGLICAMKEEIGATLDNLNNITIRKFGDLEIFSGTWKNNSVQKLYVSILFSGWGKVSAARATTRLLASSLKSIDIIFFTGVAGAISKQINQWDVIVSSQLMQHDMDARPLFDKFVIPALNNSKIYSNTKWVNWTFNILETFLEVKPFSPFGKIVIGLIATGDQFINNENKVKNLLKENPDILAVEMEGASFAQVANQEGIPWLVIRVISDEADSESPQKFEEFIDDYKKYSANLVSTLFNNLQKAPW